MEEKQDCMRDPVPQEKGVRRPFGEYDKNWQLTLQVEDDTLPTTFRILLTRGQTLCGCHIAPALGPEKMMYMLYSGNLETLGLKNCGSRPWQVEQESGRLLLKPGEVLVPPLQGSMVVTFPEVPGVRVRVPGLAETQP